MQFSSFQYVKKNGEKKNYFLLKMEESEKYTEGIVLSNMENKEVEDLIEKYFAFEVIKKKIDLDAEKNGQEKDQYLNDNPEEKAKLDESYSLIHPYIKKAYRKFITENIADIPEINNELKADVEESMNADYSNDKE